MKRKKQVIGFFLTNKCVVTFNLDCPENLRVVKVDIILRKQLNIDLSLYNFFSKLMVK